MLNVCARCSRQGSNMEQGWGICSGCHRLLCPEDIQRGCDGQVPATVDPPLGSSPIVASEWFEPVEV